MTTALRIQRIPMTMTTASSTCSTLMTTTTEFQTFVQTSITTMMALAIIHGQTELHMKLQVLTLTVKREWIANLITTKILTTIAFVLLTKTTTQFTTGLTLIWEGQLLQTISGMCW